MKSRIKSRLIARELQRMRSWCQSRIDNGDIDLDDRIYRTRDACDLLLSLWFARYATEISA